MKVFSTSIGLQTLQFIGRRDATDINVRIVDESSDNAYDNDLTATNSNGYTSVSISWDGFLEGRTYFIEIKESGVSEDELLWRGKGFCTDQPDKQNYKIIPEVRNNIIEI